MIETARQTIQTKLPLITLIDLIGKQKTNNSKPAADFAMPYDPTQYPHGELTDRIIGAAMAVHRALGPGLDESIYENSLCLEFAAQSVDFTQQQIFPVYYRDHFVGRLITDLIAENKVVVENKVAEHITDLHIAQTLSYLCITGLKIGLILNFKGTSLTCKRVINSYLK